MTKEQLKALIKECVCEIEKSIQEKKHKKTQEPAKKAEPKKEEPKKLVKKPSKKNLAKVAPPTDKLTAFDAVQLARRAAAAKEKASKGDSFAAKQARDLELAQQAANHLLKTGKKKID